MKEQIVIGKINENNKTYTAKIDIELKEKEKGICLSISGEISRTQYDWLSGGQCIDTIAEYFPNDKKLQRLCEIWQEYHLNDMQAACEHQRTSQEYQEKKSQYITVYDFLYLHPAIDEKKKQVVKFIDEQLANNGKVELNTEQQALYNLQDCIYKHYGDYDNTLYYHDGKKISKELALHVRHENHKDGFLCKPCPICGYKYGTSWLYMPIPQNIIDELNEITTYYKGV